MTPSSSIKCRIPWGRGRMLCLPNCSADQSSAGEMLGGGFKHLLFSSLFGEDFHRFPIWRAYFSDGLVQPPTSDFFHDFSHSSLRSYDILFGIPKVHVILSGPRPYSQWNNRDQQLPFNRVFVIRWNVPQRPLGLFWMKWLFLVIEVCWKYSIVYLTYTYIYIYINIIYVYILLTEFSLDFGVVSDVEPDLGQHLRIQRSYATEMMVTLKLKPIERRKHMTEQPFCIPSISFLTRSISFLVWITNWRGIDWQCL